MIQPFNDLSIVLAPARGVQKIQPSESLPEKTEGATILNEIADCYRRRMALKDSVADALALWVAHAHCPAAFLHTPRLCFCSPEAGCGKTVALDITACLVPRALYTESPSEAALARAIDQHRATMLLDEYDNWLSRNNSLVSLLNAGFKAGTPRIRCEGPNVHLLNIFGPVVLAGIGTLPAALEDRSIVVPLVRAIGGEVKERFDRRRAQPEFDLQNRLVRWISEVRERIFSCTPALPAGAINRVADKWTPLFTIAEVAGGDWVGRSHRAFGILEQEEDDRKMSTGTVLLADIRRIFAKLRTERISSAQLVEALCQNEGRPWADYRGRSKGISPNQIAQLLRPYGIFPRTIRIGPRTTKGYHLIHFSDAFRRFLPARVEAEVI